MAATPTTRARGAGKTAPSKKSSRPPRDEPAGPKLRLRYFKRMKPQRIYPLVVDAPGVGKGLDGDEDAERGGTIVIRPVIAGAQVQPAEQRLELAPGNQVVFYVNPLAAGRLPRAHVAAVASHQPPETVALGMKAKTQRLAWLLLVLAFLVPIVMNKLATGDWKPRQSDSVASLQAQWTEAVEKDLPPVPILTRSA